MIPTARQRSSRSVGRRLTSMPSKISIWGTRSRMVCRLFPFLLLIRYRLFSPRLSLSHRTRQNPVFVWLSPRSFFWVVHRGTFLCVFHLSRGLCHVSNAHHTPIIYSVLCIIKIFAWFSVFTFLFSLSSLLMTDVFFALAIYTDITWV